MLFYIDLLIVVFIGVEQSLFVEFLCLDSISLIFDLTSELPAYVLFLLGRNLLAEFERGKPVLEVHTHFKCELRLCTLEEVVLGDVVFEEDGCNVAHQYELLALVLDALYRIDHADVLAHLEGCLRNLQLHELQTLLSQCFEE